MLVVQVSQSQPCSTSTYSDGTEYWRGLASGANFLGKDLRQCLEVIHDDIVDIWNFPSLPFVRRRDPGLSFRLIIRFSYLIVVSEEKYPSWWLTSPTRKGLRRTTICKCLWETSYHCSLIFAPTQNRKHDESCRGSGGGGYRGRECCEPPWCHHSPNRWRSRVRQVGVRCL